MLCRMASTTKFLIAPALLNETQLYFQRKIKEMQAWHKIPEDLIINFDQTPLPYIGDRTYAKKKGSPNFPLVGNGRKKQITGTFTITTFGSFLHAAYLRRNGQS